MCGAMNEARTSGKLLIFAYCVMQDHIHLIVDGSRKPSDALRFINGISAKRTLDYLKAGKFANSLRKLEREESSGAHRYSVWEHHPNTFLIVSESAFMEKVNYIHMNPVRAKLVAHPNDYRWSSARIWNRAPWDNEPLVVDNKQINWRRS
jgi:putative transposase